MLAAHTCRDHTMTASSAALAARWRNAGNLVALAEPLAAPVPPVGAPARRTGNMLGIPADDDVGAARSFLGEYRAQPATLRGYTKEVERFLLWLRMVQHKTLGALTRADIADFSAFVADPQPREQWCGPKRGKSAPRYSEQWRPFVAPLSDAAQRSALIVVNVFLKYLVLAHYIPANPLALMRRQATRKMTEQTAQAQVAERVLDQAQWEALFACLAPLSAPDANQCDDRGGKPGDDAAALLQAQERARERVIVALLYFLALRVGELTTHTMGHFRCARGLWSFHVLGKGQKAAEIPVNDALLAELAAFRALWGLAPYPTPREAVPLVPRLGTHVGPGLTARRVHQILRGLCERAATLLQPSAPEKAAHLRHASPHWLRHTSLTRQVQAGMQLAEVKANARHSKMDTTMLYVHTERDARHRSMQRHGWFAQSQPAQTGDAAPAAQQGADS